MTPGDLTASVDHPLDIEQVKDLMHNDFSREGACFAVAESHGEGADYVERLLAHPEVQAFPEKYFDRHSIDWHMEHQGLNR